MPRAIKPWADLTLRQRQAEVALSLVHVLLSWAGVLLVYFLLPFDRDQWSDELVRLLVALVLLALLVAWQVSKVLDSHVPTLRAGQALGTILVVFLAVFSSAYLTLSHADPSRFTQPIDHVDALYFTVTTFATVGFGDITAVGDLTRALVTVQMVLDLVLIGLVVRLLMAAARLSRENGPRQRTGHGRRAGDGDADAS
ncbi:potassium channel family protein [Luteimicrobium subarcticum]|uniref:Ion channel n=1 Tax=Luteimicrobium subarcticum TaxID=620910 RepID=A0A2M8W470_9MICO|nr:potassium channel family protein [Luteimicrobium subarcticum]PJI85717.1 ion channel [Luteimicrobium subarcticum]